MAKDNLATGSADGFFDDQRKLLVRLIARISLYYVGVCVCAAAFLLLFPGMVELLPVGGIVDYRPTPFLGPSEPVTTAPLHSPPEVWIREATSLALAMVITLIAMIPVSWLYKAIHEGQDYDHSIDETALVMPAVVAGVVTVAQHSLALAFSLAGIVAGVRFRRALSDTFDTLFIFVAIGVGLAAGVAAIEIAVVITVFFNYSTAIICIFGDGLESKYIAEKEMRRLKRKKGKPKKNKKKSGKKQDQLSNGAQADPSYRADSSSIGGTAFPSSQPQDLPDETAEPSSVTKPHPSEDR
ncbi:MAG: DUF4956 domain-containing protein [Pseudomonadota bacterium]